MDKEGLAGGSQRVELAQAANREQNNMLYLLQIVKCICLKFTNVFVSYRKMYLFAGGSQRVGLAANREQNNMQEQQPFGQNESKPTKPAAKCLLLPNTRDQGFLTNSVHFSELGLLSRP